MKNRLISLFSLLAWFTPLAPADEPAEPTLALRSVEALEELVAPIALHPDALIALILPASTVPTDIVRAARHLKSGGESESIDLQPWDESVRALARYPEMVAWLDERLEWTIALGDAFQTQPADVMTAIQRMRARAQAAGTLASTEQQEVVIEKEVIRIVPAQPEVIYVPYYDPAIVYVPRRVYYPEPYFHFGFGFPVGSWLSFSCDWYGSRVWYFDRYAYRYPVVNVRYPYYPGHPRFVPHPGYRPWHPPAHVRREPGRRSLTGTRPHDPSPRGSMAHPRRPVTGSADLRGAIAPETAVRTRPEASLTTRESSAGRRLQESVERATRPTSPRSTNPARQPETATPVVRRDFARSTETGAANTIRRTEARPPTTERRSVRQAPVEVATRASTAVVPAPQRASPAPAARVRADPNPSSTRPASTGRSQSKPGHGRPERVEP